MPLCYLEFLSSADFFQNQSFFQEYHQSVKQFGPRSDPTKCWHGLGPNCLQRLSADGTRRQRVKHAYAAILRPKCLPESSSVSLL